MQSRSRHSQSHSEDQSVLQCFDVGWLQEVFCSSEELSDVDLDEDVDKLSLLLVASI